jgi:hypothetical protein
MFKSLAIVGVAAAGGVVVSNLAAGKLDSLEFTKEWAPETKKAISFGFTAAAGAGLFGILNRYL